MNNFSSKFIKSVYQAIKDKKQLKVKDQEIRVLSIKEANSGEEYSKVKILNDPHKTQYLELYWEDKSLYFGIDLSEDISEFMDFKFEDFQHPKLLVRNNKTYYFYDKGISTVTESDHNDDYCKGDQIYFWEYFDEDKQTRISLGYNARSKSWLNMYAERLMPADIRID